MAYVSIPTYSRSIPQRYALIAAKCKSCGTINLPLCANCLTTISRGGSPPEFSAQQNLVGSYPVAVVELDEGPRIVAQMTDCRAEGLRIGLEVESAFRRIYDDDGMIRYGIKFRPVRTSREDS
jgi:uncharacterized protein